MIAYERRGMSLTYLEMGENEWWNTTERLETVGSSPSSNRLGSEGPQLLNVLISVTMGRIRH